MDDLGPRLSAWLTERPRRVLPLTGRAAAVLVPLFQRDGAWWMVFTRRTDTVRSHAGQISFPGGRHEPADTDLAATALRESHEEIGLHPADVRLLGALDDLETVFGVRVTPWVGLVPDAYPYVLQADEVAELIALPVTHFLDPARQRVERWQADDGRQRDVHFFDRDVEPPVWGATARIVAKWLAAMAADPETGRTVLETLANGAIPQLGEVDGPERLRPEPGAGARPDGG